MKLHPYPSSQAVDWEQVFLPHPEEHLHHPVHRLTLHGDRASLRPAVPDTIHRERSSEVRPHHPSNLVPMLHHLHERMVRKTSHHLHIDIQNLE